MSRFISNISLIGFIFALAFVHSACTPESRESSEQAEGNVDHGTNQTDCGSPAYDQWRIASQVAHNVYKVDLGRRFDHPECIKSISITVDTGGLLWNQAACESSDEADRLTACRDYVSIQNIREQQLFKHAKTTTPPNPISFETKGSDTPDDGEQFEFTDSRDAEQFEAAIIAVADGRFTVSVQPDAQDEYVLNRVKVVIRFYQTQGAGHE